MSTSWRTVRVFISSTFRDMHAERDWLVKRIFPALRERLDPYRVHLVDIDLRWGVTEQQAENGGALDVCLEQIDSCRPFFLGLLGERYGWMPDAIPDRVTGNSRWGWIRDTGRRSITELEILYGVPNNPQMRGHAFFCFRDPAFLNDVPESKRKDMTIESEESAEKLRNLKQKIRDSGLPRLEPYPCTYAGLRMNWRLARQFIRNDEDWQTLAEVAADGFVTPEEYRQLEAQQPHLLPIVNESSVVALGNLEEFGSRVLEWLWSSIRKELNLPEQPPVLAAADRDPLAEEQDYHERFLESRTRVYIGRDELQRKLFEFAEGTDEIPCLVTGPSGSGKSAGVARFVTAYSNTHRDALVIPHFVGASPASTSLRQMLFRFCSILKNAFGFDKDVPPDTNSLITTFREFVGQVPVDRRVVLLIDALNQLDEAENAQQLYWLPWQMPPHFKVVASCIDDSGREEPVLKAFTHREHIRLQVEPLTDSERREIVEKVPSLSAKTLDAMQIDLLLSNPATTNPLYLLVALEELRGFGSYEQLRQRMAGMPRPPETETRWRDWLATARVAAQDLIDETKRIQELNSLDTIEATFERTEPVDDPLTEIFLQVIERLEDEFQPEVVRSVLTLLSVARRGLSDRELLDVVEQTGLKVSESTSDLFPVMRQLRAYLQHRGSLWDFFHRNLYKAVRQRYLDSDQSRSDAHARLAAYFMGQDYFMESLEEQRARAKRLPPTPRLANVRKVDELPYQMLEVAKLTGKDDPKSPHWDAIADMFTDLQFLEAKAEAQA